MISSCVMPRHSSAPLRSFRRNMLSPMTVQRPLSSHSSLGQNRRQEELLPDLVHLLAHNADDLVQRPLPEKEIVVDARAELPNVAGAEQKLVAGHFGVCRGLAKGRNKELRPTMQRVRKLSRPPNRLAGRLPASGPGSSGTQGNEMADSILNVRAVTACPSPRVRPSIPTPDTNSPSIAPLQGAPGLSGVSTDWDPSP